MPTEKEKDRTIEWLTLLELYVRAIIADAAPNSSGRDSVILKTARQNLENWLNARLSE